MLDVQGLSKEFRSGDTVVSAVSGVDLSLKDGTFAAIIGKSGSGKSTLLALLGALERPTAGSIQVGERDITRMSDRRLIGYRRKQVGFIFQHYNLIPNLTALENVMLPMEFAGMRTAKRRERASQLLAEVGIEDGKQFRKPARLSGGEQQRVAIARALANKPKLILADEPTGNLDSQTSEVIIRLLKELAVVEETTILVVTHDLAITRQTDMTFQLKDGKLVKREGVVDET